MSEKEILDVIDYVEDKDIKINKGWYYHASKFNYENYKRIFENGIMCDYLRKQKPSLKYNGQYYISVSKNFNLKNNEISAYSNYIKMYPMFIISDRIRAIDAKKVNFFNSMFMNTPLPFRCSPYIDEYQVFMKIKKEYIIGIEYMIKYLIEKNDPLVLENLKGLIRLLNDLNLDLPIYDYSANKEINKEKVLKL